VKGREQEHEKREGNKCTFFWRDNVEFSAAMIAVVK
jgi:hypothetical protein